jgi:hypothetical protein
MLQQLEVQRLVEWPMSDFQKKFLRFQLLAACFRVVPVCSQILAVHSQELPSKELHDLPKDDDDFDLNDDDDSYQNDDDGDSYQNDDDDSLLLSSTFAMNNDDGPTKPPFHLAPTPPSKSSNDAVAYVVSTYYNASPDNPPLYNPSHVTPTYPNTPYTFHTLQKL